MIPDCILRCVTCGGGPHMHGMYLYYSNNGGGGGV